MPKFRHPTIKDGTICHEARQYEIKDGIFQCDDERDIKRFTENENSIEIGPNDENKQSKKEK